MSTANEMGIDDLSLPLVRSTDPDNEEIMSGNTTSAAGPFYDAEVILEISQSIASGYFILITGGSMTVPDTKKSKRRLSIKSKKGVSPIATTSSNDDDGGIEVCKEGDVILQDDAAMSKALNTTINTSLEDAAAALQDELPQHLSISWLSIINGNVIDSCFGVKANGGLRFTPMVLKHGGSKQWEKESVRRVKTAKEQLNAAAESHPAIKLLAIEAYGRCMQVIATYHQDMDGLGTLSPLFCHRAKSIRRKALHKIREAFEHLAGAVESTL